jgi:hypothetical protein
MCKAKNARPQELLAGVVPEVQEQIMILRAIFVGSENIYFSGCSGTAGIIYGP